MNVLKYKLLSILLLTVLLLTIQSCGEKQVSTTPRINQSDSINKSKIDIEKAPKLSAVYDSYDDLAYLFNHRNDTTYVINFWATWCPPCREEMPELSELNTEYQDKNVIVIGIALDEIALIKEFNAENKMSYPLLAAEDTGGNLAANLGNNKSALPYTVIIKPDGTVANTYFGRISKPLLEEALLKLIP